MSADDTSDDWDELQPSCDPALTRREFVGKLVKRSLRAGTLLAAPVIIDAFIAPQKAAAATGGTGPNGCAESGCGDSVFQPSGTCPGCGGP